jgi:sugar lactone lactonase YvrE
MLIVRKKSAGLLFGLAMVCASAVSAGGQSAQFSANQNFGSVAMGQTSPAATVTATFSAAETIGAPQALTIGAAGKDYAVSGGTCKAGQSYAAGNTCTVQVTFAPLYAGTRNGAVVLQDQLGNTVGTAYLQGIGTGPQAGFQVQPGSITSFPGNVIFPDRGVAVDGAGDIFVGNLNQDGFGDTMVEVPAGCVQAACVKQLPGKHDGIWGVAVDGAGNVFVADVSEPGLITEFPASGGYTTAKTLTGNFGLVQAVAVDGSGNVFVSDFTDGAIKEMTAASGYATTTTIANGFQRPGGIAVDGSENVFFTDGANVKEIVAVNGSIPATPTVKVLGSGLLNPIGLVLDASGNIYVIDSNVNHNGVYEILAAGGYTTVTNFAGGFTAPSGIAIDSASNMYVVDLFANDGFGFSGDFLDILPRGQAAGLAFPTPAPPGSTESGGFSDILTNVGNAPLDVSALTFSSNNFVSDPGTTCTASIVLAPGANCVLGFDFTPQATGGAINGTLTVTDNSLNVAGSTQQVALSGQALYTPTVVVARAPSVALAQTLTVTITVQAAGGNPVPTGTVVLYAGAATFGPTALVNGVVTFQVPAVSMVPGAIPPGAGVVANISMSAAYTPDAASANIYAANIGQNTVLVTSTALLTPTVTVTPQLPTVASTQPVTLTAMVAGGAGNPTPTGSVTLQGAGGYTSTPATLINGSANILIPGGSLPVGTDAVNASYVPDAAGSNTYLPASAGDFVTVTAPPPPVSPVTPGFGNAGIGQTSAPTTVTLTFAATTTIGSITAMTQGAPGLDFAIVPGGTCVVGASYSSGQSCTVNVTFSPTAAGLRNGGVVALDASGTLQAQAFVHGTGTGPQMVFLDEPIYYDGGGSLTNYPASDFLIGDGFSHPGATVDGAGNVFIADFGNNAIKEIPAGCTQDSCQKVLMAGLASPWAIAVDGAGNLFVASLGYNLVFEIPIGCQTLSCLVQVGSGYDQPYGVALDSSDNVFVADGGNGAIKEVLAAGGYTTVNTLVSGLNDPWSVVVDANENLFVGEGGNLCQVYLVLACNPINTQVVEIPAANDYSQTNVLGAGVFGKPMGLAIDGSGNVFVGDFGDQCPFEFLVGNGYTGATRLCSSGFLEDEESIGVEGNENLILPNVLTGVVEKLDFADPPTLTFRSPALVGELDNADGEQAFAVQNQGNAPLIFTSITLSNPSFQIDPNTTTCSIAKPLAPGGNCLFSVFFEPTTTGLQNATLTLTDNNLNVSSVTQVIQISGDSVPPAPTIMTEPANPTGVPSATFTFSDTQANVTFECSIDGLAFGACASGVSYSPISAGQHSFQVRALDPNNFLSPASVYSWTVTGTAVTPPTITSGPGHITSATSATFSFTDTEGGVTYLCSLDGAAFTACTSGVNYTGLGIPQPAKVISVIHSFAVEAEAGGSISQPTSYAFTVTIDTVDVASTDFGAEPVGQTSAPITVNFAFDQFEIIPAGGDTIATIDATTLGIKGLDYSVSSPGTCAVGTALTKTSTCSMQVTFTPSHAGQRKGAIILLDPSGAGIGEAYLNGTGTAPQVTFTPYTPVNFTILPPQNNANPGKDLQTLATDSTMDGAGNLYVTDDTIGSVDQTVAQSVGDVWVFAPGCTTPACIKLFATASGTNNPLGLDLAEGIALDGAGMLFQGGFFLGGGSESTVGTWTPPDCGGSINGTLGFNGVEQQPAVDGWGQVYYIGNGILTLCGGQLGLVGTAATPVKGHLPRLQATKAKPEAGGNTGSFDFSGTADSLAVDPQGNIWVADSGNNAVKEVLASSGFAISQVVGSGFLNPESVASDSFGNIFVNDAGNGEIKEMTVSSGYATILTVAPTPVNKTFSIGDNISVDAQGNVYVPNQSASSNGLGVLEKLDFADAPALVFPTSTKVGSKDATDGTMTATVNNSGNAPLTISALAITGNSFQIDSNATTCSASTTLAVGGSCTVGVFFEPDLAGAQTGTLTVTDNALNANNATQTFQLSGTGFITPTTAQPTVTVTPAANSINTTQTLSVTITVAGKNPTPVPTGVVTLSTPTYNSATTTLTGGTATITIPAGALAAGSDTLTAIYSPDQASSTTYGDGAGFATVTVTAGTKSTPTVTVTPSPATVTIAQDFSVMVTVAAGGGDPTPTGTVTLLSGAFSSGLVVLNNGSALIPIPARMLAAGTDTLMATYAPDTAGAANYNNATGSGTETVQPIAKTAPTLIVTPNPNNVSTNQALMVAVSLNGGFGNPSPTGTVTLSGGGFTSAAITLNGGVASIPIAAGSLSLGSDTLTANYTPDVAGAETYTTATGASLVTVNSAGGSTNSTGNFGTIPVGQTSPVITLTFTFESSTTIGSVTAMLQGAPALDFAVVNGGSCTAGASFTAGSTCTANVTFSPQLAGLRYGAVIVKDGSGNTVATDLVNGIGSGPQVRLVPRLPRVTPPWPTVANTTGDNTNSGVVDGIGDIFFLKPNLTTVSVMEVPAGCTAAACVMTLAPNTTIPGSPYSLALDLSGNLFIAVGTGNVGQVGSVWELTAAGGYQTATELPVSFGAGYLTGLALDQSGNIFVAISGSASIQSIALGLYEVSAAGGYSTATPIASAMPNPYTLAIDMSGNLFVSGATATSAGVYEVLAAGGYTTVNLLGNGFSFPGFGSSTLPPLASVDQSGDVFFIDGATFGSIDEIQASGGYQTVDTIPSAYGGDSIDVDASDNFYLFEGQSINKVEFNDAYVAYFVATPEGTTDTTDAQRWVTVENIGNAPLNLTSITPPSANFVIDSGTTTCSISTPVAAGGSCVVGMDFVPSAVGALTGTLTLTDNSLNVTGATQSVYLSGTGTGTTTPTVTVTPSASSITTTQALTVTATVSGGSGNPTPTGTVILTSGTYISAAVTLSSGSATINIPAGSLASGADTLTVSYVPDTAGAATYTNATGTNSVTVAVSLAQTSTALIASALNPTVGASVTFTATVAQNPGSGVPTGTVTFMDGATALGTGTLNGSGVATFSTAALALGAHSVTAVYGGDTNNAGSTSAVVTVTVTAAQVLSATLTPGTLTFTGLVGTTSAAQTATLTNTGNTALSITGISVTGANSGDFGETNECPSSLAPQQTCTISVTFTPASAGSLTATLSVADNATAGPPTVTLNGTGTAAPTFTISSPTGAQTISAGGSATYTITVTPENGSFNNAVTFAVSGLPAGATGTFQPTSVTPGSSPANSTLTIQTGSVQTAAAKAGWPLAVPALAALALFFVPGKRRRRWITMAVLLLTSFGAVTAMTGCGGGFAIPKAPTQAYTVTVTATSGTVQQTTTVQLTVQ